MHLDEGTLQAYADQELLAAEQQRIALHLESCAKCQQQLAFITTRTNLFHQSMDTLTTGLPPVRTPVNAARARLTQRVIHPEETKMFKNWFTRKLRPVWAGLLVIALLAFSLAFPPVRAIANNFLGLFRVEQITVIPVEEDVIEGQFGSSPQFENLLSNQIDYQIRGELQQVKDKAEASKLANITIRMPDSPSQPGMILVQPGGKMTLTVSVRQLQALLDEIGQDEIEIPDRLDGEVVTVDIPDGVLALYGDCQNPIEERLETDPDQWQSPRSTDCTTFLQMHSPTITAPPDLDINQIGQAFLQILGMDEEEAARFAATVDWTTTLVLPIPRSNTTYRDVMVDGVNGTLITQGPPEDPNHFILLWVKNDVIYGLTSDNHPDQAIQFANSIP